MIDTIRDYKKIEKFIRSRMPDIDPFIYCNYMEDWVCREEIRYDLYVQYSGELITSMISLYKQSVRLWLSDKSDHNEIIQFLSTRDCNRISMDSRYMDYYSQIFVNYHKEVLMEKEQKKNQMDMSDVTSELSVDDYMEVASLLVNDDSLQTFKSIKEMATSLQYRNQNKNCKNVIIKKDGVVASHACTLIETEDVAIIGAVITNKDYRNKGMATKLVQFLCSQLLKERKKAFLFAYNPKAISVYEKSGFKKCGEFIEAEFKL